MNIVLVFIIVSLVGILEGNHILSKIKNINVGKVMVSVKKEKIFNLIDHLNI